MNAPAQARVNARQMAIILGLDFWAASTESAIVKLLKIITSVLIAAAIGKILLHRAIRPESDFLRQLAKPLMPRRNYIRARRKIADLEFPISAGNGKPGVIKHADYGFHPRMHVAPGRHHFRNVKMH